ncbi:hypothetical protein [endosymbiont GvMRE of Glomus versiforme]|uniref:hypothetical protein n=1 Tax=endosymbiont GvMRE of Glomus versiforme TaxID=2039283 RepID=UPI000EBB2939|nr:hypothetical protein [endosymbiont GvMRE of Glomus versiforme]RHZ36295.1 hypothetical protein GvMRE_Ic1g77 [endosymbiont GvMRE of Glomus versiforme]
MSKYQKSTAPCQPKYPHFKYHYLNNTLAYQQGEYWHEITEDRQFQGSFGSQGFKLENGWISFTTHKKKIRVFAKLDQSSDALTPDLSWKDLTLPQITYYRKDLSKECPTTFTFTTQDEVEKINGKWRNKHE